jgi:hypothetical protein
MSLFQCEECGCCENTALSGQGCSGYAERFYSWAGLEERKGKKLCSACAPTKYSDGTPTEFGVWHDQFDRVYLPKGMFVTDKCGDLAHKDTRDTDFRKYAVQPTDERK